jgi:crotonobetainyl-CoA:carnitine CoA-transferase CaiB-like acyl-CoA transferase
VIVENLPLGSMDRLHLGWSDVSRINPRIVMISSQLMGTRGPWKDWRGYGANTQPVGGLTSLWSYPGLDAPVGANVALPDHIVGRLGAMAAVACLVQRLETQRGCHVEIAQVEVVINLLAELFAAEVLEPGTVGPQGNRSSQGAPWGVYPCAGTQRWCVITCRSDEEWERLRTAMGDPAWATEPRWGSVEGRRAEHDELDDHLASWTSAHSDRQVMDELQAHGVAAAMMAYPSDQPGDPHLLARGYIRSVEQPGIGPMLLEGPAFSGSDLADVVIRPAPRLGEHTRAICAELLEMPAARVDELIAAGALFVPPE